VSVSTLTADRSEAVVLRWVLAFNARDLDGMLACVAERVVVHPLRLGGLASTYRGREGVREWVERSRRARHDYRIAVCEVRDLGAGKVFSNGSLSLGEETDIGPICTLHQVERGLIVTAREYLTEPDMLERLGLIP
jgi:ketosteroid isomerase-like protein